MFIKESSEDIYKLDTGQPIPMPYSTALFYSMNQLAKVCLDISSFKFNSFIQ
jgi:hypothetical protein